MYKDRILSEKLCRLAASFPVVVVSGARQVGKTTLLKHVFPKHDYVVFDPSIDVENARKDPDLFLRSHPGPLILDEIQYAPEVVSAVKRHVDQDRSVNGHYLLTGSQQWQVMKALSESLAGRAVFLDLRGFTAGEMTGNTVGGCWLADWVADSKKFSSLAPARQPLLFTMHEWLWRGSMPEATQLDLDMVPEFWAAYQRTYIERDARLLGEVSDWQQFGLFLRLAGAMSAREVNFSQLGREIGMTPQTARRWTKMLEGTFQWFEIPSFKGNEIKRVSSKPKGYLSDTGLICHGLQLSSFRALPGHPMLGALFETAVVNEIIKMSAVLDGRTGFYHWRSAGGAEVDLILERDGILYPFEIKATSNPGRGDASGLAAFRKSHPRHRMGTGAIVCAAERTRWVTEDVVAIPWDVATRPQKAQNT